MKQVLLDRRSGEIQVSEVPVPAVAPGQVLIATRASLISSGTERSTIRLGEKSLLGKARARPEQVRKVLDSLRSKGLLETARTVRARLAEPSILGYSAAGEVLEVGEGVEEFARGDRVACAGAGFACHAEVNCVPRNLVVPLPASVSFEAGAFVALGSIALHGIRTANVEVGDHVVVVGLGLVGLLAVQLLRAAGCVVYGFDPNPDRVRLARESGAEVALVSADELEGIVSERTRGRGADAVLVTAATASSEPVRLAGAVARDRGSVCVVGDVGLEIPREPYYEKELVFRISRSYGPGRYDPGYELLGHTYPIGFVPWDERRNMEAVLEMVRRGDLEVEPLISRRYEIADAQAAYVRVRGEDGDEAPIGVILTYGRPLDEPLTSTLTVDDRSRRSGAGLLVVGAGNFATATLLPRLKRRGDVRPVTVVTRSGASARAAAEQFGFERAGTSVPDALEDPDIGIAVIATRHSSHAELAEKALRAGLHVFVEKPLAISVEQLHRLAAAIEESGNDRLMVGFNRRFSDYLRRLRDHVGGGMQALSYRVNAGPLPADHWTRRRDEGGGRIIGEGCHFIDAMTFVVDALVTHVHAAAVPPADGGTPDTVQVNLKFEDGSVGHLLYGSIGDPRSGKERLEAFGNGCSAWLEDYRQLELWSGGRSKRVRSRFGVDKGFDGEIDAFIRASLDDTAMPIPLEQLFNTTLATFAIERSLSEARAVPLAEYRVHGAGGAAQESS